MYFLFKIAIETDALYIFVCEQIYSAMLLCLRGSAKSLFFVTKFISQHYCAAFQCDIPGLSPRLLQSPWHLWQHMAHIVKYWWSWVCSIKRWVWFCVCRGGTRAHCGGTARGVWAYKLAIKNQCQKIRHHWRYRPMITYTTHYKPKSRVSIDGNLESHSYGGHSFDLVQVFRTNFWPHCTSLIVPFVFCVCKIMDVQLIFKMEWIIHRYHLYSIPTGKIRFGSLYLCLVCGINLVGILTSGGCIYS